MDSNKELADSLDKAVIPNHPYFNRLLRILTTRCMTQAVYFAAGEVPPELFYHYGTTVVMPDLIFKPGVFTKAATYAAGTQYYTEANGVYTAVSITEFASGTTYYTMA